MHRSPHLSSELASALYLTASQVHSALASCSLALTVRLTVRLLCMPCDTACATARRRRVALWHAVVRASGRAAPCITTTITRSYARRSTRRDQVPRLWHRRAVAPRQRPHNDPSTIGVMRWRRLVHDDHVCPRRAPAPRARRRQRRSRAQAAACSAAPTAVSVRLPSLLLRWCYERLTHVHTLRCYPCFSLRRSANELVFLVRMLAVRTRTSLVLHCRSYC